MDYALMIGCISMSAGTLTYIVKDCERNNERIRRERSKMEAVNPDMRRLERNIGKRER